MIYTPDRNTAISPRHVIAVEIKDMGDQAIAGRLTGKRITEVWVTLTGGGVCTVSKGTDYNAAERIFADVVAEVERS